MFTYIRDLDRYMSCLEHLRAVHIENGTFEQKILFHLHIIMESHLRCVNLSSNVLNWSQSRDVQE